MVLGTDYSIYEYYALLNTPNFANLNVMHLQEHPCVDGVDEIVENQRMHEAILQQLEPSFISCKASIIPHTMP